MEIKHLKDCPEHLDTVATWIYNEWWTEKPDMDLAKMTALLKMARTRNSIPLSLVAMIDDKPVGTVNFIESDNSEFPELKPWLAALLVAPEFRRRGVGSALVKSCIESAQEMKVKEFFLGTDIPEFYKAFGFEVHTTGSKDLKIMRITLTNCTEINCD